MDISKIEAGEISINLSKIDIFQVINSLVLEMQPLANEKGLDLNFKSIFNELFLLSDMNRIEPSE